jgi:septal ring factor EnvC (AmiA/AmiB activator)|tara:strand:+ start:432 stop:791 length:360 start_codon:yes stop_codon:yes gene_type:complete
MDWFQSKTTQIIALVGIVGTLAGFGYTGAEYVNRLENLESKIGGISEAEDEMKIIEERFASIETSVQFLEKEIDNIQVPDVTEIKTDIATIIADLQSLNSNLEKLENKLEKKDDNPLSG